MSASDNLSSQLFHGTRAKIKGQIINPGPSGFAYATTDRGSAELFGKTKMPEGELGDNKVYRVMSLGETTTKPGNFKGETHHISDTGFLILGEA
jgi:hypothetical protein